MLVERNAVLNIIDQMRIAIPQEIQRAAELERERDRVLDLATAEAEEIVAKAQSQAARLISESSVLREAEAQATAPDQRRGRGRRHHRPGRGLCGGRTAQPGRHSPAATRRRKRHLSPQERHNTRPQAVASAEAAQPSPRRRPKTVQGPAPRRLAEQQIIAAFGRRVLPDGLIAGNVARRSALQNSAATALCVGVLGAMRCEAFSHPHQDGRVDRHPDTITWPRLRAGSSSSRSPTDSTLSATRLVHRVDDSHDALRHALRQYVTIELAAAG